MRSSSKGLKDILIRSRIKCEKCYHFHKSYEASLSDLYMVKHLKAQIYNDNDIQIYLCFISYVILEEKWKLNVLSK